MQLRRIAHGYQQKTTQSDNCKEATTAAKQDKSLKFYSPCQTKCIAIDVLLGSMGNKSGANQGAPGVMWQAIHQNAQSRRRSTDDSGIAEPQLRGRKANTSASVRR